MILDKLPIQTVCTVKDDKGKECNGHLKKYYPFAEYFSDVDENTKQEIIKEFGQKKDLMLYRCRICKAIYRPGSNSH
jgi:hypothetical protein